MSFEAAGVTDFLIEDEDRIVTAGETAGETECSETADSLQKLAGRSDAAGRLIGASARFEATENLTQAVNSLEMTDPVWRCECYWRETKVFILEDYTPPPLRNLQFRRDGIYNSVAAIILQGWVSDVCHRSIFTME